MDATSSRGSVLVIGSANIDMVVSTERFPHPGETIFAREFGMYPGGKGANQAVACAKLGAEVAFLARMGDDIFSGKLLTSLREVGVDTSPVLIDPERPTGIALITVDASGENEIVVVSGSNMALSPGDVEEREDLFDRASFALFQLEIPLETVDRGIRMARSSGCRVILNPAPAAELPVSVLERVDFLTPNESELETLTGMRTSGMKGIEAAARRLLSKGVGCVIATLGERGALIVERDRVEHVATLSVEAVDSTAAGDAFNGALAFALSNDYDLPDAVRFANRIAAFTVTRMGAQTSMPTLAEAESFHEESVTPAR